MPGANGIGLVRSLAKLCGILATGGKELGLKPETFEAITTRPTPPPRYGIEDKVLKTRMHYSFSGFLKPFPEFNFSPSCRPSEAREPAGRMPLRIRMPRLALPTHRAG